MDRPGRPFIRRVILGVAFMALVYAVLAIASDVDELLEVFRRLELWAFGAAFALALGAFGLRAIRWFVYLRRLDVWHPRGGGPISFREAFGMSLATGKAGHVVKSYYLTEAAGLPFALTIPVGLAERMTDVIAITILLLISLLAAPRFGVASAVVAAVVLFGFLQALRWERTGGIVGRFLRRFKRLEHAAEHVETGHAHLRPMLHTRPLVVPVALGLVGFLLEASAMWMLGHHGLGLTQFSWGEAAFTLAAADVAGTISLLPGGLGVIDVGMFAILALLDVPFAEATAIALLIRVLTLWLGGLLDVASFLILNGLRPTRADRPAAGDKA